MSADLTPRECGIAYLVACRWQNKQIGAFYNISSPTVEYILRKIFHKVHVESRYQLAWWWINGIVDTHELREVQA